MVFVQASVLGGLPVIADVWFSGPDYFGEYDVGVNALYWMRRDGSKGAELSEKVMDRVTKDSCWGGYVTEQANDWLSTHCPTKYRDANEPSGYRVEGKYSEEYRKLNPEKD